MTEINTTTRAGTQPQQQAPAPAPARREPEPTVASANRLTGLASGLNTEQTINTLIQVERRRLKPVEEQRAKTDIELRAFEMVSTSLGSINETAERLKGASVWEGKIVESSNEEVVTATATMGAKPGKHTVVVERLALNHQIASQGYETQEQQVGTGRIQITVGEGSPITVVIDEAVNTLTGLKDAINTATNEVNATIIKTGSRTTPYQLVLTSQKTGSEGRIGLDVQLQGGIAPNFRNSVEEPSDWKGVGDPAVERPPALTGVGASTAIVNMVGEYTGEEDNTFTFTSVQTGVVGGERQLQVRWTDTQGRSGMLNLDALNYAPGEPLEFVDGLALVFSDGELIVNDSFSVSARAERSGLSWWVPADERGAAVSRPTAWGRQREEASGAPVVEGHYTGTSPQEFTLTIVGSGQVGRGEGLSVRWEGSLGESGELNVGQGYEPGTALGITQGLTLTLRPGVLSAGQVATFEATPETRSTRWWLADSERVISPRVDDVTTWSLPGADPSEAGGFMPELPEGLGPRVSTAEIAVSGEFSGDEAKVYTFTALRDGSVGTTKDLRIQWDDSRGNTGVLTVDETYLPGTPLPVAEGIAVAFGAGRVFKDDSFTLRTRTSTIQAPQDALVRFGATELGGGLEITNPTNELDTVIEGVRLNLLETSERPVTITIRGDTQQAFDGVKTFVQQYNELATIITELTKFDKDNNIAGPLLGNRDLAQIKNSLSNLLIDPVAGLPRTANMLLAVGIGLNDQGLLNLDESTLHNKIQEDFSLVADLFRNKGQSDNSNVAFVGMSDATRVSTGGYAVDVTRPATQGHYRTPPLPEPIVLTELNNRVSINVDGTQSEPLKIEPGAYSLSGYARALQDAITNDEVVGQRRVRVVTEGGAVKVLSGRFGASSAITFVPTSSGAAIGPGLMEGESVPGADVAGTVDGVVAEGTGQLLRMPDGDGPAAGLRMLVKASESQLNAGGPEARIVVTRGVASRVSGYLGTIINPQNGQMRRITQNLRDQASNLDTQLQRMEERITSKRQRLQERFTRLESQLSTLKQQQSYMQSQLAGMGGGASLPGLPR